MAFKNRTEMEQALKTAMANRPVDVTVNQKVERLRCALQEDAGQVASAMKSWLKSDRLN